MAAFLSDEWLAELAAALRRAPEVQDGPALALGQVVTDVPALEGTELAFTIRIGGGEAASVEPGTVEAANAVLVADYESARAIASGTPAADLLAEGKIKLRGDATALIAAQDQLARVGAALAEVAVTTHFDDSEPRGDVPQAGEEAPVLERATIVVAPGREEAFAAAFPEARAIILSADGCRSARLLRGVESPSTFLLLVEWASLEHHTRGFRESELFAEWRRIVGPFFAEPPSVEHFVALEEADEAP